MRVRCIVGSERKGSDVNKQEKRRAKNNAAALRRIAASLKGRRDNHGNPARVFEAAAERIERSLKP